MSDREKNGFVGSARATLVSAAETVEPYLRDGAKLVSRKGRDFLKTKTGKRAATGAAAGGVLGAALPFVSILGGAMVGASLVVLVKSLKDRD